MYQYGETVITPTTERSLVPTSAPTPAEPVFLPPSWRPGETPRLVRYPNSGMAVFSPPESDRRELCLGVRRASMREENRTGGHG